ncbi:hypothetical protein HNQ36_002191 [Afipia massiliensis]|uniref:Transposase n=1 Tax=Afipia massiliensis TaxID=211460 RepID=A0A840N150_9BRAD|nr:DUF6262 family protein [Afipia massiliensis]MBB5052217.1 hypothetical protein [Afipia massiliensis]
MTTSKSTQEIAAEHFRTLKHYLDTVESLPARGGKLNVSAVAEACGFDRGVLYTNPECNRLLKAVLEEKGLGGFAERDDDPADERRRILEHRVNQLEQRNAALMAENEELRAKVRQFGHIENHVITTGRLPR